MAKGKTCKTYPSKPCNWIRCNGTGCWREKAEKALEEALDGDKEAVKKLRECIDKMCTTAPPHNERNPAA